MKTKKSAEEWLDYLHHQFPSTVGHKPLEEMVKQIREEALREAADVCERVRKIHSNPSMQHGAENCRDSVLSLISTKEKK